MEAYKVAGASVLRLELLLGTAGGNPVLRRRNIANVKYGASDQDLFDVAKILGGLQQYPVYGVIRVDNAQLIEG